MDRIVGFFTNNWQRKLVALFTAVLIWLYVNRSIHETKIIPNVPIKVINLPTDKTVAGIRPNGMLGKRTSLTLTGPKRIVDDLDSGDLEILIDASTINHDDWIFQITKKNLVSLNPAIDLNRQISHVGYPEFVIKFSKLITAHIPITITNPIGKIPDGYLYLDVWPKHLTQTIVASEDEIKNIPRKGLEVTFDLGQISTEDLDRITAKKNHCDHEVSFLIPNSWKKVTLPFSNAQTAEFNDSEAQQLHVNFLKKEWLPIEKELQVAIFYPSAISEKTNPQTLALATDGNVHLRNGLFYLKTPLYVKNVSQFFLNFIQDRLELAFVAQSEEHQSNFPWSLEVVDAKELEEKYVAACMSLQEEGSSEIMFRKEKEEQLKNRFQEYLKNLNLYVSPEKKLVLESQVKDGKIYITPLSSLN